MLMIYSPPVFSQFEVSGLITNDSAVGIPNARVTLLIVMNLFSLKPGQMM